MTRELEDTMEWFTHMNAKIVSVLSRCLFMIMKINYNRSGDITIATSIFMIYLNYLIKNFKF